MSNFGSPEWSFSCYVFSDIGVDVAFLRVGFEDIFVAFPLSSSASLTFFKLGVEDLFQWSIVSHPDNMAVPSQLVLNDAGFGTGCVGFLQDTDVRSSVFPADLEDASKDNVGGMF